MLSNLGARVTVVARPTISPVDRALIGEIPRIPCDREKKYFQYLKAKGFDVSFTRSSETVPPLDLKITLHDDPATSPIIVIIAPSAL